MEIIKGIAALAYMALAYWAVGQTIYANKIRIGTLSNLFVTRFILGLMLGLFLIPIALLKRLFTGR